MFNTKWPKFVVALSLAQAVTAHAATLAIIDSGVDNEHSDLESQFWINDAEEIGNGKDDDWNAYVDDIHGWNFADRNNLIIDRTFIGSFSPVPARFFELQEKVLRGTITPEEQQWIKETLANKDSISELQTFGNFVHGTHVAGIAQSISPGAQILALKIIPTKVRLPFNEIRKFASTFEENEKSKGVVHATGIRMNTLKALLFALSQAQGIVMSDVGRYLHRQKIEVANGSFGLSMTAAKGIVSRISGFILGRPAETEEIESLSREFVLNVVQAQRTLVNSSKATLFVFAAGNDGTDNDTFPVSPANIKEDNTISVAATDGLSHFASFSNYGASMVDVAAPGVAIRSSIPGESHMMLSGTSQAAPYVAGVAAEIRKLNPELDPAKVKRILMETVDKYTFLKGRVATEGMVNPSRAFAAAAGSLTLPLDQALEASWVSVPRQRNDIAITSSSSRSAFANPLPLGIQFLFPKVSM